MCTASLDITPIVWSETQKKSFPYFTINRTCVRWEDVVRYKDEREMTEEQLSYILTSLRPPRKKELPIPDEAKMLVENVGRWMDMNSTQFDVIVEGD